LESRRVGRAREELHRRRRDRRARRERRDVRGLELVQLRELRRDRPEALLALARSRAEAGVALDLLDVAITARHAVLEIGERHVLAATEHDLAGHAAILRQGGGDIRPDLCSMLCGARRALVTRDVAARPNSRGRRAALIV